MAYIKTKGNGEHYAEIKGLKNQKYKSKSIPLMTTDKKIALSRLEKVKSKESLIKYNFIPRVELYNMFDWLIDENEEDSPKNYSFSKFSSEYKKRAILSDMADNKYSFIYIINAKGTNFYKIGKADCINSRVKDLQTSCMYKLNPMYSFKYPASATVCIEKNIQNSISPYQTSSKNEWFCFTGVQINGVVELLKGYTKIYSIEPKKSKSIKVEKEDGDIDNNSSKEESISVDKKREYNDRRKDMYKWKHRAENANIPLLPNHRPSSEDLTLWMQSIRSVENVIK